MSKEWTRRSLIGCSLSGMVLARTALGDVPLPPDWLVDRRLPDESTRLALTQAYLDAHLPEAMVGTVDPAAMRPELVVLHWTGSGSAEGAFQTFAPARLGGRPELQGAGALNVGAHFIVHRDGACWQILDERRVARHVIGLNHCAIGIENVGDGPVGGATKAPLTPVQVDRNVALVRALVARHPSIRWLIGHHEYRKMESTALFSERDPGYRTTKVDPGDAFMAAVRSRLTDLGLSAPG